MTLRPDVCKFFASARAASDLVRAAWGSREEGGWGRRGQWRIPMPEKSLENVNNHSCAKPGADLRESGPGRGNEGVSTKQLHDN